MSGSLPPAPKPAPKSGSGCFAAKMRVFLHLTKDSSTLRCFSLRLTSSSGVVASRSTLTSLAALVRKSGHPGLLAQIERVRLQLGLFKSRLLGQELRAAGLVVREEVSRTMGKGVLLVTSPNSLLDRRAEMVGLPKVVAPHPETKTLVGGFLPGLFLRGGPERGFIRNPPSYAPYFVPAFPNDPLASFTPAERATLVLSSIESPPAKVDAALGIAVPANGGAGHDLEGLMHEGLVDDWCLLHDQRMRSELEAAFSIGKRFRPEAISRYFGAKLAMYFAFLRFYTLWGVLPSLVGVVMTLIAGSVLMEWLLGEPQDEAGFPVWHSLMVAYALFISSATMVLMSLWARQAGWYSHLWGARFALEGLALSGEKATRPAFVHGVQNRFRKWRSRAMLLKHCLTDGEKAKANLIKRSSEASLAFNDQALYSTLEEHGAPLLYFPPTRTFRRQMVSFCVCIMICVGLVAAVYFSYLYADVDAHSTHPWARYVSTVVTGLVIPILDRMYKYVADVMTDWELHMTDAGHEASLIGKLVIFRFLNAYTSIIFVAFLKEDLELVAERLIGILITGAIVNNAQESLVPWVKTKLAAFVARRKAIKAAAEEEAAKAAKTKGRAKKVGLAGGAGAVYAVVADPDPSAQATPAPAAGRQGMFRDLWIRQAEAEIVLVPYDNSAEATDYLELVIQYGYITFFAVAFPLAAGLALINNIFEMRVDGLKLLRTYRRPRPATSTGIGAWRIAFELMSLMAIACNMLIIGHTDDVRIRDTIEGYCRSRDPSEFPCGPSDFAWTLIILEHMLLAFKLLLIAIIPMSHTSLISDEHRSRWFRMAEAGKKIS